MPAPNVIVPEKLAGLIGTPAAAALIGVHADGLAQQGAGMTLYDAVYRRSGDARGESHDSTSHAGTRTKVPA